MNEFTVMVYRLVRGSLWFHMMMRQAAHMPARPAVKWGRVAVVGVSGCEASERFSWRQCEILFGGQLFAKG